MPLIALLGMPCHIGCYYSWVLQVHRANDCFLLLANCLSHSGAIFRAEAFMSPPDQIL